MIYNKGDIISFTKDVKSFSTILVLANKPCRIEKINEHHITVYYYEKKTTVFLRFLPSRMRLLPELAKALYV